MKITFLLQHADMAGGVKVVAIYAQRLMRRGHEVRVVSTPWPKPTLHVRVRNLVKGLPTPITQAIRASHLDQTGVPHDIIESTRPIEDRDVPDGDAVIATWWETANWVAKLSPAKGKKHYFIQHYETWGAQGRDEAVDATWKLPLHKIVISKWLLELARDRFGDAGAAHVPNSVDMAQFHAPPRDMNAMPTVGFLYSNVPFKGADICFKAIEAIRRRIPELRVVSFGADEPIRGLPLPPGTDYTRRPAQDRIRDIYARCDLWLCASRSEGFHLPPLEAMACRCPVVSTRVGGPMDVIDEGKNGFLVDVEDVDGLADRALGVLSDRAGWRGMSDAAYTTAERYTWDDATALFEAALRHV